MQTIRTFCLWSFFGIALSILIWWIPVHSDPYLVKVQFIDPQIFKHTLGKFSSMHNLLRSIKEGLIFSFYRIFHYIPLIIFLTLVFFTNSLLGRNKNEKRFLSWQFLGITIILSFLLILLPNHCTYITAVMFFLVFIYGIALIRVIENIKNLYFKKKLVFATSFLLFIACSPVIRTAIFPLTWQKEDTYDYNKKLILSNIEKGSKVFTDVVFWYILNKDYEIFDLYFASLRTDSILHNCSYILLRSGMTGKPDLALPSFLREEQKRYFYDNFTKVLSTMSNEPNKIFGLPISRSRWCYRFELYKRK